MSPRGAHQLIRTSLILGIQFDDYDYRLFLRNYHKDLRNRFPGESFPAYAPADVLNELIPKYEPNGETSRAGGRFVALRDFSQSEYRLDLAVTASDFGPFEQRKSPYSFDRSFYHLGRTICSAQVKMDFPGYNPYPSTRAWPIAFIRDNLEQVFEFLPDYLWWAMHDQKDLIENALAPEQLAEGQRRVASAGYKLDNFGLYLATLETLHMHDEEILT